MRLVVLIVVVASSLWAGEYAVLTTGFRIQAERHATEGEVTTLYHAGGGYSSLPNNMIASFEQEEYVAPPKPEAPVATQPAPSPQQDVHALVKKAAEQHGVDPRLISSVIAAESAYNPKAISSKGAAGLMQLMPGTARDLGVTDRLDPSQNINGGTAYLKKLLERYSGFKNQLERAVAAYNAGPATVDSHGGLPPYRETIDFVSRVARKISR